MKVFVYFDKIAGVLGSLAVHVPVDDVNLEIVEVLKVDYHFEPRTILYRDKMSPVPR